MASTFTPALKIEEIGTGDQAGTWGTTTNNNFLLFEQAITGVLSVAQGDSTLTLTNTNGAIDQARNAVVIFTGAITADRNVIVPTSNKVYIARNATTGGFNVIIKTAAGTGVTLAPGTSQLVYCDGTNVVAALTGGSYLSADANNNLALNNFIEGYATTATAAGTTTLTVASAFQQYFTGTTTQTVVLPVVSTLVLGQSWQMFNSSTGLVTINSSGGSAVLILAPGTSAIFTCIAITGTSAASWNAAYLGVVVTSGKQLLVSDTMTLVGTDGTTFIFPAASDTLVGLAAAQTLTNKTFVAPALGTPASGVATNLTGTAASLTAGNATAASGLVSATTTVVVSAATAPSAGQVLTATSGTAANWASPAATALTLITTLTPSGVASAAVTGVTAGYRQFYFEFDALVCSTAATLTLELSSTNGAAYGAAGTLATWINGGFTIQGAAFAYNVSSAVAAGKTGSAYLTTSATSGGTTFSANGNFAAPTNTAAVVNALRIGLTSGTFTGTIRCWGLK